MDGRAGPLKPPSLQRRLLLQLGLAVCVGSLLAAAAAFLLTLRDMRQFQDDTLRQIAVLGARTGGGAAAQASLDRVPISDPDSRLLVLHVPGRNLPAWATAPLQPGFHTLAHDGMRIYVLADGARRQVIAAQPTEDRNEVALSSALRALLPALILVPLLSAMILRILRVELASLRGLAAGIDRQAAHQPEELELRGLPLEILPFAQAINRLLRRVDTLVEQQRRFVADAAHELRSPLTAISLQVQNLRQLDSVDAMRERLGPLQAGIERTQHLSTQLLDLARIESDPEGPGWIDAEELARELIAERLPRAAVRGIDLGLESRHAAPWPGSRELLRAILANALDNALQYTVEASAVTVRLDACGAPFSLEVLDQGPGIPQALRHEALQPFHRLPGSNGVGSGLGLAIAREAAERLGGRIELLEHAGGGLRFRYTQARRDPLASEDHGRNDLPHAHANPRPPT
jgi:two-component system OmpR family sensor kinase